MTKYLATKCPSCGKPMIKCTDEIFKEENRLNLNVLHGWGWKEEKCFSCENYSENTRVRAGGEEA